MPKRFNIDQELRIYKMIKRKLIGIIVFAIFFMILGRNLTFLPKISLQRNNTTAIEQKVRDYIKSKPGNYGIYFEDLNNNQSFSVNGKEIFTAASVNKVPIVAVLYYLDNKGQISLDDKVTIQKSDIQDYGTGSIRYASPGGTFTLKNLARLSLVQSDNTTAHILGVKIGMPKIQKIINSWGLTQTDMVNNKTSAFDMSVIFKKIYKGEITNTAKAQELLEFLTKSDTEDRLPVLLPKTAMVYHKTGDVEGAVNDVGIIQYEHKLYYIGILTSDVGDNENLTKKSISEISKMVYQLE